MTYATVMVSLAFDRSENELRVLKVSFAHRCRTVLRSWNGAARRNFQPESSSSKRAADIIVVGADGRDALADPFMQPIRAISSCSWAGHCLLFRNPESGLICGAS